MSNELLALSDYTMLDPEGDLDLFLSEASTRTFAAICVLPEHVQQARASYSGTIACAAGGFPNGDGPLHERIAEVKQAIVDGADEIDIVMDFDALMDGERDKVATDLAQMRQACGDQILKVILETPELDLSYIELGAKLALEFGADFIKTCTGRRGGCTPLVARALAELLATWSHENNGKARGLKLSGGIREPGQAEGYLDIVRTALGDGFVHPATFRFGTSRILS
ncbi:MAG: Deoxyribose-phosphate aldolase [Marine Group II euryarchaeote MED-G33]|nr:MAG: Deoxyribose-phosphate aldolase [Marine Group II euryarchaeote MED-G33]